MRIGHRTAVAKLSAVAGFDVLNLLDPRASEPAPFQDNTSGSTLSAVAAEAVARSHA